MLMFFLAAPEGTPDHSEEAYLDEGGALRSEVPLGQGAKIVGHRTR